MVHIKIFLNNYYIKNHSAPHGLHLEDILPKLKEETIYKMNMYYKDRGKYNNTNAIDMRLFYYEKKYYIFENINGIYYKLSEYEDIIYEPTIKLTLNETSEKYYKIEVTYFNPIFIFTKDIINIKTIMGKYLKKYDYTINNIDASCTVSKEGVLLKSNNINEIYLDVYANKKSIQKLFLEYLKKIMNKIKNKINIYG